MIPFRLTFQPGISIYEQVVYAAKKSVISGQMRPGEPFPSVVNAVDGEVGGFGSAHDPAPVTARQR